MKYYQSLGDKSGKWKEYTDQENELDGYSDNEFEGVKGFYSSYCYKVRSNLECENFDFSNYENVKFYKLK